MKYDFFIEELKKKGSVLGLENIRNLLKELGNPQDALKIVHIAGTNGKGSIFAYLSSILQEDGMTVGRYISPTIQCYEERFQINGHFIEESDLEQMYELVYKASQSLESQGLQGPTLFEAETAIAYLYFKEKHVDYALIECGMGGLTDATNVIAHPVLSVIASISFDHMAFLGNTLAEIAFQKAGIIKEGIPVVVAPNISEVQSVIAKVAKEKSSKCILCDYDDYQIIEERYDGMTFAMEGKEYETHLPGLVQAPNAATAILAARILGLSEEAIREGIRGTSWPGRLELLSEKPLIYRDGAHNPDAAKQLSLFLKHQFSDRKIIFCLGILKDKDYDEMLSYLVPLAGEIITFTPQNARGLDGRILADAIRKVLQQDSVVVRAAENMPDQKCVSAGEEGFKRDVAGVSEDENESEQESVNISTEKIEPKQDNVSQEVDMPSDLNRSNNIDIKTEETVNDALKLARAEASPDDVIIVCGSLSFMEEMQPLY